ncbi:hypothetical protein F7725_016633 [Dissostichus mawsoni]|uniref:CIDE-N domain-containing protein n=1 Tax=Dissostichus mawsoni TaxID=36200 RepID=A0A7J5Z2Q3_DISMA|nr:hypothetical protein F7725_016633 [Dissostichus mawsoni]
MDYAMKMLTLPTPSSLSSSVTAGLSAGASMTQQLLKGRAPPPKPFRVSNADRSVKKGIMADTLEDLINKTLPENAVLMVLEKECKWTPPPRLQSAVSEITSTKLVCSLLTRPCRPSEQPSKDQLSDLRLQQRKDVIKLTFDLYKNSPKDFIGCLNMKATMYGVYSLSYDLRCHNAKNMLKEVLRWAIFTMQATGHVLLGSSGYIEQQLLEEDKRAERRLELQQESLIELPQESLIELPQASRIRQLQSMLLRIVR